MSILKTNKLGARISGMFPRRFRQASQIKGEDLYGMLRGLTVPKGSSSGYLQGFLGINRAVSVPTGALSKPVSRALSQSNKGRKDYRAMMRAIKTPWGMAGTAAGAGLLSVGASNLNPLLDRENQGTLYGGLATAPLLLGAGALGLAGLGSYARKTNPLGNFNPVYDTYLRGASITKAKPANWYRPAVGSQSTTSGLNRRDLYSYHNSLQQPPPQSPTGII